MRRFMSIVLILYSFIAMIACGRDGEDGTDGNNGSDGNNGRNGVDGIPVTNGRDGTNGSNGTNGSVGPEGSTGPAGDTGPQGETGATGPQGNSGADGQNGIDGTNGQSGILEVINPCGKQRSDGFDEVLLRLADGTLVAVYFNHSAHESGLATIGPGSYVTTDGTNCHFTVTNEGEVL